MSLRKYPRDCPPLVVKWFHAVDVPKRKPLQQVDESKPPVQPKKYIPFSDRDSRAIEQGFQKLSDDDFAAEKRRLAREQERRSFEDDAAGDLGISTDDVRSDVKMRRTADEDDIAAVKVPVNEDFLFDVDVERRELAPAYWLGPVYDCRRGNSSLTGAVAN